MILGISPYIIFDGQGQQAVKFYEEVLDAKVNHLQTFGDMPDHPEFQLPEDAKGRVLHAHLTIGQSDLMISDTFPGQPLQTGSQVQVSITTNSIEKSKEVFSKLEDGGKVGMALQETFWSPAYGSVTDQFGVTWQISTYIEEGK